MLSLMYWIVYIDYIISWQPYAIMAFNLLVLSLIGYANKDNGVDFDLCSLNPLNFSKSFGKSKIPYPPDSLIFLK